VSAQTATQGFDFLAETIVLGRELLPGGFRGLRALPRFLRALMFRPPCRFRGPRAPFGQLAPLGGRQQSLACRGIEQAQFFAVPLEVQGSFMKPAIGI